MREVFFELNGIPRTVEVFDEQEVEKSKGSVRTVNERADPLLLGSVGAPMAGKVTHPHPNPNPNPNPNHNPNHNPKVRSGWMERLG